MRGPLACALLSVTIVACSVEPPDTSARIKSFGYPAEMHKVETEDGYILTVYRIPHGVNQISPGARGRPLILQHGILCSSDIWVMSAKGPAFVLAEKGYDVWLPNSRGNTYSRAHKTYSIKDKAFWNYSFHEMGYYDLPALIDHILRVTGERNVTMVGHSQGTTSYFVMASTRTEYQKKVRVACTLAPVAFLDATKGIVRILKSFSRLLIKTAKLFNVTHILDHSIILSSIDHVICKSYYKLCYFAVELLVGFNSAHLDKDMVPFMADVAPTGASVKQLVHFSQLLKNGGKFRWFDYEKLNQQIYNSSTPPEYDLSNIYVPTLLYYGPNDFISTEKEVYALFNVLKNVPEIKAISSYNHLDFMWAKDADLLYEHIVEELKKY